MPFRSRMSLIGQFSPAEVAEMEQERAGDQLLTSALGGQNANGEITEPTAELSPREQAEALGAFIRAGVAPESAAAQVGLGQNLEFIDALPVTLKPNRVIDAEIND